MVSSVPAAWAQTQTTTVPPPANNAANVPAAAPGNTALNTPAQPGDAAAAAAAKNSKNNNDVIGQAISRAATPLPTPADNAPIFALGGNTTENTNNVPPASTADIQARAFDNALNNTFPLSPDQIQQVMKRMSDAQQAGRAPPDPDPNPVVKIEDVLLDPGVPPPLIKVASGYVTTVNILDVTGQPWPIQDVVVGGNFAVTGPNDAQVLRLIPQTRFGRGNLSVRLVGLSTPVTFRVEAGGSEVYYRYDARIPQSGPGAKQPLIDHGFTGQAGDSTMMAVLAGVPPTDAKRLDLTGTDGRTKAWKINGQFYLRTPLTLLSPGWDQSVRSADGTSVYVVPETPVLMLSDNGQMVRSHIDIPPEDPFHPSDLKDGKVTVPVSTTPTTPLINSAPLVPTPVNAGGVQPAPSTAVPVLTPSTTTTTTTQSTTPPTAPRSNSPVQIYTNSPVPTQNVSPISIKIGGGS